MARSCEGVQGTDKEVSIRVPALSNSHTLSSPLGGIDAADP